MSLSREYTESGGLQGTEDLPLLYPYIRSMAYSLAWWQLKRGLNDMPFKTDVEGAGHYLDECRQVCTAMDGLLRISEFWTPLEDSEADRLRAAHEALAKRIDSDERARRVWYDWKAPREAIPSGEE